jgi:trigger factor
MNITRENIDELNAVIRMTVDKSDYEQRVNDVLKNYQKKANMPGFRPGKVPAGLIRKMYGTPALVDEINKLVSENLSNHITDNKLEILGEPLPSEQQKTIDFDTQEEFEFAFDVALTPELDVKLSKKDKVSFYTIQVTDEMLDTQVKTMTGRFGHNEAVAVSTDKSLLKGDFVQVDAAGAVVEGGIAAEDSVMSVTIVKDEAEKARLLGKSVGDQVVFDPKTAFPNATEISYLLKISREAAEEVSGLFRFTIKEITEFKDPELNQELFDKVFGPGVVSSEEEMIAKVKENLENTLLMESDYRFSTDAREKLTGKFEVKLPEAFLKRWLKATNRENKELTDEQLESEMPRFIEDLKWQLIKNQIVKANDLKIEHSDVLEFAKKTARVQFMQYGLSNIPDEHVESYAVDMMKNQDQGRRFAEGAINDKVMAFVKEAVKLDIKEVTREAFNKLFDKN